MIKRDLALVVGVFISTIAVSMAAVPDNEAIIAKEKAVWQSFKQKDADAVKKLLSPDVVAVYPDGIYNFQQRLDSRSKIDMKSFSLSDFNVSMPAADTVIISYKAKVEGKDIADYNCGTVWSLKNGEWRAVFHSDMKAAK